MEIENGFLDKEGRESGEVWWSPFGRKVLEVARVRMVWWRYGWIRASYLNFNELFFFI